jgi:hypothetical protein
MLVIIDDVMNRNSELRLKAYQRSFSYFCRYLEAHDEAYKKIFMALSDSKLNAIG